MKVGEVTPNCKGRSRPFLDQHRGVSKLLNSGQGRRHFAEPR